MFDKFNKLFNKSLKRYKCIENKENIKKLLKDKAIFLDVRSPQEYREGHIEGAILIPEYEIFVKAKKILKDKEKKIIVYCNTGIRSKKATEILKLQGYKNVYNICNGISEF